MEGAGGVVAGAGVDGKTGVEVGGVGSGWRLEKGRLKKALLLFLDLEEGLRKGLGFGVQIVEALSLSMKIFFKFFGSW